MAWTYILLCGDGTYYVGSTTDLDRRLGQHQAGEGAAYTRHRLPVTLVWAAQFDSVKAAFGYEKQVQGWGRRKRQALIDGREDLLPRLASRCWSLAHGGPPSPGSVSPSRPSMPWDVPHRRVDDPEDPWAPLVALELEEASEEAPYTRIVPEGWSRDGC